MCQDVHDEVGTGIPVPGIFTGILWIYDQCGATAEEIDAFQKVLCAIRDQLQSEGATHDQLRKARIIFTKDGSYKVNARDRNVRGAYERHIVFPMDILRKLEREWMYAAFSEELCHHIWNIDDEVRVKYKNAEILSRIFPEYNIYAKMLDENNATVCMDIGQ